VQYEHDPNTLIVRARIKGDLERLFPRAKVFEGYGSDYRFRCFVPRERVAKAVAKMVECIDYSNFKNTVDRRRRSAYSRVWDLMAQMQDAQP
jgi:hypothetical protein